MTDNTIAQLLRAAAQQLSPHSDYPLSEARQLLSQALARPATWLIANDEQQPDSAQCARFSEALQRRCNGEPLAYITGHAAFWSLELKVTPDTLIPRPDSEVLVEQALECFDGTAPAHVLDLGTGTGALALALAKEWPASDVTGTDIDPASLRVARDNALSNHISNAHFCQSDWFGAVSARHFGLIVTNPPYIADNDPHLLDRGLQYEPRRALTSGRDGLDDLRLIIAQAPAYLSPAGWLLCEHGYDQGAACRQLFAQAGYIQVQTRNDYAGHERVTLGRKPHT
ncbi:peptide chain release factor N(5)-glutamine methyltransferase [Granulosicoccaceae sp. 1_MG-2023]|nr:peptide chain release factor N(5)-glutamine methyltransferase [Granulosicoccaceae sp. 1_MG-2023]